MYTQTHTHTYTLLYINVDSVVGDPHSNLVIENGDW